MTNTNQIEQGIKNWKLVYGIQKYWTDVVGEPIKKDITIFWDGLAPWPGMHHLDNEFHEQILAVVEPIIKEQLIAIKPMHKQCVREVRTILDTVQNPTNPKNTLDTHEKSGITHLGKSIKHWEWRWFMSLREMWDDVKAQSQTPGVNWQYNKYEQCHVVEWPTKKESK